MFNLNGKRGQNLEIQPGRRNLLQIFRFFKFDLLVEVTRHRFLGGNLLSLSISSIVHFYYLAQNNERDFVDPELT
jgi:hypothetical protein